MSKHTQTVIKLYEAFQRGDLATILGHTADNIDWDHTQLASKECPWNGNFSGREKVPGFFKALAAALDFTKFEPVTFVEQGNHVVVHLHIESNVRKNGRHLTNDSIHFWTFDEAGRVARYRHFNDTAAEKAAWQD